MRCRLLDRGNPRANSLIAANQFIVQGERDAVRADVVLFVNGLPLALMELKSPADTQATLGRAHIQLQTYRAKAPELLRFNQVCVISDGVSARLVSLTAGLDRFAPVADDRRRDARRLGPARSIARLGQMLVRTIRASASIDWTKKESVRAKMRIEVRKMLARYGYPPVLQKAAVDLVIRQAEALAADRG